MDIWNQPKIYKTISDLIRKYGWNLVEKIEELESRIEALENRKGPGRPKTGTDN